MCARNVLQDGATVTCYGVDALDIRCNQVVRFLGGVTMLASGGSGHIYPSTTNPLVRFFSQEIVEFSSLKGGFICLL
jgi:aspartate oxidase